MPPEERLQSEFGVSRATMRLALDALQREGLIARFPGRGTFVNERHDQPHSLRLKASIEEIMHLADGVLADFVITEHVMAPATAAEAVELKILEGRPVLRVTGLRRRGEVRVAHVVACVPETLGTLLELREGEISPPIIVLLRERLGQIAREARQIIGVTLAVPVVAGALKVSVGTPLLTVRRTYFGANGAALEFAVSSYPGQTYQFETIISGEG